jgi:hypothetical protein
MPVYGTAYWKPGMYQRHGKRLNGSYADNRSVGGASLERGALLPKDKV